MHGLPAMVWALGCGGPSLPVTRISVEVRSEPDCAGEGDSAAVDTAPIDTGMSGSCRFEGRFFPVGYCGALTVSLDGERVVVRSDDRARRIESLVWLSYRDGDAIPTWPSPTSEVWKPDVDAALLVYDGDGGISVPALYAYEQKLYRIDTNGDVTLGGEEKSASFGRFTYEYTVGDREVTEIHELVSQTTEEVRTRNVPMCCASVSGRPWLALLPAPFFARRRRRRTGFPSSGSR